MDRFSSPIQIATIADARAIASIHVRAWQAAYADLLPAAYLDDLSIPQRTASWELRLQSPAARVLVQRHAGEVVGWIDFGPSQDAEADTSLTAEIYAIYIDPPFWRSGYGTALMQAAQKRLRDDAKKSVTLWVLEANVAGRCFYDRLHGRVDADASQSVVIGGQEMPEVRYRWNL